MDMLTNQAKICSSPHETRLVIKLTKILKNIGLTPIINKKFSYFFRIFGIKIAIILSQNVGKPIFPS